jgi:hypothetical protein
MAIASRTCPLCGTVLSAGRFARVMDAHRGIQTQLTKLRAAEERATAELARVRDKANLAVKRAKDKASRELEDERRQATNRVKQHQIAALKLKERIGDLERRLRSGETAQSEGLLEERSMLAFLQTHFPDDVFSHPGKAGDIVHDVRGPRGVIVGRIVYEVKRVTSWSAAHVKQCAEAQLRREADIAVLVTNRFPARKQHHFVERGVLVISPLALLPLIHTAREGLLRVHALRVSGDQKRVAVQAVFDYLAAGPYAEHIRRVAQHFTDLEVLFHKEMDTHERVWQSRLTHYRGLVAGVSTIHDQLRQLLNPIAPTRGLPASARMLLPQFAGRSNRR